MGTYVDLRHEAVCFITKASHAKFLTHNSCDRVQDRFHRTGHNCSKLFDANTIPEMAGINSSFMEQVNAQLQLIKQTGYNMSQTSFLFFAVLLITLQNRERRLRRERDLVLFSRLDV